MDIKKMQSILMEKGIRISDDDPVFVFIALNEIVIADMTKKHLETFNEIDKRVADKLTYIVDKTVSQIAGKEAEARAAMAITTKTVWVIGGELFGLMMFAFGMSYGSLYSTWTNPAWINRSGLLSVISSVLLKTPTGGVGCFVISLTLVFLQKNLTDLMYVNEEDKPVLKILVYLTAALLTAEGLWLSYLVMFK